MFEAFEERRLHMSQRSCLPLKRCLLSLSFIKPAFHIREVNRFPRRKTREIACLHMHCALNYSCYIILTGGLHSRIATTAKRTCHSSVEQDVYTFWTRCVVCLSCLNSRIEFTLAENPYHSSHISRCCSSLLFRLVAITD